MENLLEHLNQEQLAAVTHKEGPLMIIAGAGTGKTTVITHRIGWLIEQKLAKPEEILALTFTEKAAAEMEERVDRLLPYGYIDLQISTFHAFCERLLREYGVEMGLSPDFILLNELDAWLLMRKEFERFDLDYYRPLGNPTRYIKSFLHHFSRAKDELITPEMYLKHAQEQEADLDGISSTEERNSEIIRLRELAHAYHLYQCILLENDALDFGDLISYTIQLLQKRPLILKKIRERFRFVLVDEFQDTNLAQYELVKQIAAPINNITVVGDDDQSIYKFRGASLSNILQFESDYPESHRVILTQNYRSAQTILDHAYIFIQANNPYRLEARGNGKEIEKKLRSQKKEEGIVQHLHYATLEEEVRGVIQKMVDLKNADESLDWKDFGILVRANSSADVFVEALEQVGIPYQFMALRGLYTKPVILDMLAWMRIVDHPFDSVSFYRVLTHGPFTIPTEDLLRLNHLARKKGKSLFEVTKEISLLTEYDAKTIVLVQRLLSLLSDFAQEAKEKTCAELFLLITKDSGLTSFIDHYPEAQKQEAFRFLQKFYTRLRQFELRHPQKDLHHFLKEFEQEQEAGESGALSIDVEIGPDVVHVMTVHGSKGLEFRYVFVVNLVDRRFPTIERKDPIELPSELVKESLPDGDRHLQEERRLFYVAMTRAKDGLYFTSAEDYGGMRKKKLSRFLMELGIEKTLLEKQINPLKGQDDGHQKSFSLSSDYKYTLPKRFSFTQLTAFETCPLQYKYAHLLKIPMLGKWTFSYGKTMHHTLQRYFELWIERIHKKQGTLFELGSKQAEIPVSLQELLSMYEQSWIDEWYPNDTLRENYRSQGRDCLKTYMSFMEKNPPKPISLEQGFVLKLGPVTIKGRIDRMDTYEDGIEIIDYKTGSPKKEGGLAAEDKRQLLLYQLAAKEILGLHPKKLTFHYLQDHSQISFLGTEKELEQLEEYVCTKVEEMKISSFAPTPGYHCRYCDFADICEFKEYP